MQSEIDETNLRSSIARFSAENDKIKAEYNKIKAENDKIRAENSELKARIAKLEDMQTQNELIKNLLSHIIDRLPESLIKRAYQGLLNHSKNPVPLEMISGKSSRIESYLRHKLEVYENSLNRKKRKTMTQEKILRPRSWPEYNVSPALPTIHVVDSRAQTDNNTWPEVRKHDYEEENNRRVMNELKVLSQHLLDYNKRTFGKFMQDIEKDYRERVSMNKKLRCENEDLKMQLLEAEKELASIKSNSSH
ncbi:unnamed protein product [Rhizophagus irregularis]|nr:unnamed protein product [Rhizophagus irregularis]